MQHLMGKKCLSLPLAQATNKLWDKTQVPSPATCFFLVATAGDFFCLGASSVAPTGASLPTCHKDNQFPSPFQDGIDNYVAYALQNSFKNMLTSDRQPDTRPCKQMPAITCRRLILLPISIRQDTGRGLLCGGRHLCECQLPYTGIQESVASKALPAPFMLIVNDKRQAVAQSGLATWRFFLVLRTTAGTAATGFVASFDCAVSFAVSFDSRGSSLTSSSACMPSTGGCTLFADCAPTSRREEWWRECVVGRADKAYEQARGEPHTHAQVFEYRHHITGITPQLFYLNLCSNSYRLCSLILLADDRHLSSQSLHSNVFEAQIM
jgi:hypothetical protein